MSIRSNIEEVMELIRNGDTALGQTVQARSVNAIKSGSGTPEWEEYMGKGVANCPRYCGRYVTAFYSNK